VTTFWEKLQHDNPTAHILASSLDSFAAEVLAGDLKSLPTVTQELGDSWLYGAPADPIKLATFREARRVANQEVAAGRLNPSSALYDRYMRRLMKGIPSRKFAPVWCTINLLFWRCAMRAGPCEHNWGYSVGGFLPELRYPDRAHPQFSTWPNQAFHSVRNSAPVRLFAKHKLSLSAWRF
jgi:hypothetical protein